MLCCYSMLYLDTATQDKDKGMKNNRQATDYCQKRERKGWGGRFCNQRKPIC